MIKFCVDDFGITDGVNDSVVKLHLMGLVNYAAFTPLGDSSITASVISNKFDALTTGLHLAATDLDADYDSQLLNNGRLISRAELIKKILLNKIKYGEIYRLFMYQYELARSMNVNVKFLNTHQDVHCLPIVSEAYKKISHELNLPFRNTKLKTNSFIKFCNHKSFLKYVIAFVLYSKVDINLKFSDYFVCLIKGKGKIHPPEFIKYKLIECLKSDSVYEVGLHTSTVTDHLSRFWREGEIDSRVEEFNFLMSISNVLTDNKLSSRII